MRRSGMVILDYSKGKGWCVNAKLSLQASKEKHDEKGQHKGRYGRTVPGGVTRVNEHLSEISSAKVAPS